MPPRVSVVVPSFNNGSFIEATMDSILAQTYTDFELVVADHSSTDDTWDKLQQYAVDPRVTLLQTEAGGGAPRNWTRVTREAKGELLKLVCGDDLIYPTCLAEEVAVMDADPSVGLVACRRDLIDARGSVILRGRGLAGLKGRLPGQQAARATVIAGANIFGEPACVLMRRELHEKVGGWDAGHPYIIDEASYVNVLLEADFYALDRSLAGFRLSAGQWSVNLARQQSSQVIKFHQQLAARTPTLLSRTDLIRGNTMARAMAYTRRLAYLWVGRRMHAPDPADVSWRRNRARVERPDVSTESADYTERLRRKQTVWWKRLLPVQAPYHWNLRRQELGRTLDIGCGIGRNLGVLPAGSVGVDHNAESVALARGMGYAAYTVDDFMRGELAVPGAFDGMLVAHVIEHMERDQAEQMLRGYLPFLRPGGRVFLVCPQERGYASDPTHVWFAQGSDLVDLAKAVGLEPERSFSFPFPSRTGKLFIYNEFCVIARVPA